MSDYQYCSRCGQLMCGTNPSGGHICTVIATGTAGPVPAAWNPKSALAEINELKAENARLDKALEAARVSKNDWWRRAILAEAKVVGLEVQLDALLEDRWADSAEGG